MFLKDKNTSPPGGFYFYYRNPATKEVVRVPQSRPANGVQQLATVVRSAFVNNNIPVPDNLELIVEHQICIRQADPKSVCYSGGLGDTLHHSLAKPVLEAVSVAAEKAGASGFARAVRKVSGCSGCGGTRVYEKGKNNLGRAGKLNKL